MFIYMQKYGLLSILFIIKQCLKSDTCCSLRSRVQTTVVKRDFSRYNFVCDIKTVVSSQTEQQHKCLLDGNTLCAQVQLVHTVFLEVISCCIFFCVFFGNTEHVNSGNGSIYNKIKASEQIRGGHFYLLKKWCSPCRPSLRQDMMAMETQKQ